CPFRHRTRYYDSETWLYYYGYRYYDPSVTKWISKDPLGEAGGWNLTAFCGNDPVNTFDPLGLAAYLFDGTWVDKDDQKNPVESNVARLWKNYGGTVWYREGVGCGNRVGGIRGFFSKVFGGFGGAGWDSRLEWMYKKLEQTYVDDSDPENKQIDIFGFSRGAGMARDFANMIKERGIMYKGKWVYPEIRFLGVFDTVASSGLPGNDINPGKELSLPDNVLSAAHALSGHEVRGAFPLTLFADDPRVDQQWFSGVHSDTGGAYGAGRVQGYIPLYWMYTKAWEAGVPLGAFPQDYYSAIMRYRFRYDLDWNELWSSDIASISTCPFLNSSRPMSDSSTDA
ncbi:MAG: hypothetical protein GX748_09955, partial [Lentisphaerae bacterium]|nr:hypothetical protein [Lentisphaerota bacterium]